jgi:hypothetical protein
MSQLAALVRIHDRARQSSQFVIPTHSPILTAYPGATIYACSPSGITPIAYHDAEQTHMPPGADKCGTAPSTQGAGRLRGCSRALLRDD